MVPGSHYVLVANSPLQAEVGRLRGWELRDTLLILTPGVVLYGFLFRVPLQEATIVDQVLKTGTGALAIDLCRVYGRWPANLLLVHHSTCNRSAGQCHEACPIRQIDAQSGILTSGVVAPHHRRNNTTSPSDGGYRGHFGVSALIGYGDSGGASRFYPQFDSLVACVTWLQTLLFSA
jgi:hypothetical protein